MLFVQPADIGTRARCRQDVLPTEASACQAHMSYCHRGFPHRSALRRKALRPSKGDCCNQQEDSRRPLRMGLLGRRAGRSAGNLRRGRIRRGLHDRDGQAPRGDRREHGSGLCRSAARAPGDLEGDGRDGQGDRHRFEARQPDEPVRNARTTARRSSCARTRRTTRRTTRRRRASSTPTTSTRWRRAWACPRRAWRRPTRSRRRSSTRSPRMGRF
jgi:hypothetical protein